MKRILCIAMIGLALSCNREAPRPTDAFLLTFKMPEECLSSARYKDQTVLLKGTLSYEFRTDAAGCSVTAASIHGATANLWY